jgi:hypothetical protein
LVSALELVVKTSSTSDYIPKVSRKQALKEEVIYTLLLSTKETFGRAVSSPMEQNIPCKNALPKNHPEKSFDPKLDFDLPQKLIRDITT